MNRIKENLLLPIVLQVTQVPLGLDRRTDIQTDVQVQRYMLPTLWGHKNQLRIIMS
jgi:hypothetical protein